MEQERITIVDEVHSCFEGRPVIFGITYVNVILIPAKIIPVHFNKLT